MGLAALKTKLKAPGKKSPMFAKIGEARASEQAHLYCVMLNHILNIINQTAWRI